MRSVLTAIVGLAAALPCAAATPLGDLLLPASPKVTQTASGRWSSPDSAATYEAHFRASAVGAELDTSDLLKFFHRAGPAPVRPVLETQADLQQMLLGGWTHVGGEALQLHTQDVMQVIVDIPPVYDDDRFDQVRKATTAACKRSAHDYLKMIGGLARAEDLAALARMPQAIAASAAYDRDCLAPLATVPLVVRQVTGILVTTDSVPFCSATAVGKATIVTAKHCFFDPRTGEPNAQFAELQANQVSYRALEPKTGINTFTLRAGKGAVAGAFNPASDVVLLTVTDGPMPHFARVVGNAPAATAAPVPTWIVGLNTLVGDIRQARPATDFVRGSSPKGCSVVEVPASGCLVHSCQTAPGTSGAGVLEIQPDGPVLIGVHISSSLDANACGVGAPVGGTLNLAAAITSAFLNP